MQFCRPGSLLGSKTIHRKVSMLGTAQTTAQRFSLFEFDKSQRFCIELFLSHVYARTPLIFSRPKAVLFWLSFTNATLQSEQDFLSSALSGERTSFLPLTFPLFSERTLGKWLH